MDTIRGFGNGVGGFSGSAETGQGRKCSAGRDGDSDVFWRSWDHFRSKARDVNALSFVLVGRGDDLVDC